MICDLFLVTCLVIYGPGAISYTPVLENVAQRRVSNGWGGLPDDWYEYDVLVATPGCAQLGRGGWLITKRYGVFSALVVDCTHERDNMLHIGLLVDASWAVLHHEPAWLVLQP